MPKKTPGPRREFPAVRLAREEKNRRRRELYAINKERRAERDVLWSHVNVQTHG